MPNKSLKQINNNIKININEATGTSDKCKNKLLKIIEKNFYVTLPKDNFKNIDIEVLENGNIRMRGEEYKTTKELKDEDDLHERYSCYEEEVENLLNKSEIDFDKRRTKNDLINLIIILVYVLVSIVIIVFGIRQLLVGDIFGILYLVFILGYYIIPMVGGKMRDRLERAKRYLKSLFK